MDSPEPSETIGKSSPSFKLRVREISEHHYKKDVTRFKVLWDGYDIPAMYENLETILMKDGGPACLGIYLRKMSKRALRNLLEREPILCQFLKR